LFYLVAMLWLALSPSDFARYYSRVTLRIVAVILGIAA
jgi:hypothetical protein